MRKKMQESILHTARLRNESLHNDSLHSVYNQLLGKTFMYEDATGYLVDWLFDSNNMISCVIFDDRSVEII